MRDYEIGDEVVFVGSGGAVPNGPGPFFCTGIVPALSWTPCLRCRVWGQCEGAVVEGAPIREPGVGSWCVTAWKKAPKGEEIERKAAIRRRLKETQDA